MEALLPSEIARLVFGYLEDQKCDEAARSFLEASSHLQECRTALLNGRRFNTRVNGYTLVDIFDKFSAAHSLVQERLSKVGDCEQVRQCGDLLEQLRFLIGGSRGQRFVVNINVPSQANSQTYGGSPIITSSIRKRYHSSSDRDRNKRSQKPLNQLFEKQPEPVSSQLGCETVEATPLESLPGHTGLNISHQHEKNVAQDSDGVYCTSTKNDFADVSLVGESQSVSKQICHHSSSSRQGTDQENSSGKSERYSPVLVLDKEKMDEDHIEEEEKNSNSIGKGKTTATSTDELTTYSSIEVQTTPYPLSDSESIGLEDEPIENLSLLTKELLNRTELQERIAENINKAILPIEMPSKDESICESMGGELNTSIMAELNNAIKSIVAATETDPIFEHFLDEIIGPNVDTDTSPDEDNDVRVASEPAANTKIHEEPSNTAVVDMELEEESSIIPTKGCLSLSGAAEVPLKQRLRSSSRQQNNKLDEDGDKSKEPGKTDSSLEDHNAAAIMSIINANIVSDKIAADKAGASGNNAVVKPAAVVQSSELSQAASISSESQVADSTEVVEIISVDSKSTENKIIADNPLCSVSNPEPKVDKLITEQEMMAMPTLIVCSQEEIRECINVDALYSSRKVAPVPSGETRFVPIAPKISEPLEPVKPMYLKAVHVPVKIPVKIPAKIAPSTSNSKPESMKVKPLSPPKISGTNRKRSRKVTKKSKNLKPAVVPTTTVVDIESSSVINKEQTSNTDLESITLYANDNSFGTMIETGNMPTINLDDSMTLTGTGLSPYLKFNDSKSIPQQLPPELPCEKQNCQVPIEELDTKNKPDVQIVLPHTENVLITRRTPKSLLKSRSKNNRLSLSTPRRRSSHIRALDFNTPTKSSSSEHKLSGNKSMQFSTKSSKRARSVCRTSLFKSPPFSNSFNESKKVKTPVKDRQFYKIPIATRSPAPKLMGGWDKYTGVGMILGGTSPHPSSSTSFVGNDEACPPVKTSSSNVKKSWDADLRQALQEYQQPTCSTLSVPKKGGNAKFKGRGVRNSSTDTAGKDSKSETNESCDQSQRDKNTQQPRSKKITHRIASREEKISKVSSEVQNNSKAVEKVKSSLSEIDDPQIIDLESQDEPAASKNTDVSDIEMKTKEKIVSEIAESNKREEKPVVKKYAKLKTLETKISKYKKSQVMENTASCSADSSQKKCEYLKISPESRSQTTHMSRLIDLETPRKTDNNSSGIPPTPRLLSPSSSTITPFTKIAEELGKVPSFISTPDFPPTPSIALTPKAMGENTIDAMKKGEYSTCSPYYQPSTEQPDILVKLVGGSNSLKDGTGEVLTVTSSMNLETRVASEAGSAASNFAITVSSSKLEITQFEVIKENLPKEEADRELKISSNSKNSEEITTKVDNLGASQSRDINEAGNAIEQAVHNEDSNSSSGNESSDSSSSETSSSSSCSSSCSCSSIATTSTPFKSVTKCKTKSNSYRETSNDCNSKNIPIGRIDHNLLSEISPIIGKEAVFTPSDCKDLVAIHTAEVHPSVPRGEISPVKLLPLVKTQEEVNASEKETPAKDEALLSEANISETPSSSKSGIESLTNLNSKISALDSPGDRGSSRHVHSANKIHTIPPTRQKAKIISIQHFLPDVSIALKPPLVSEIVSSTTQPVNNVSVLSSVALDGKLSNHLEEKRLRLMAKLKNKTPPKVIPQKVKVKQVNLNTKNKYKEKQEVPKISANERKTCINQTSSNNPVTKVTQVLEKKEFVGAGSKIQTEEKREENSSNEKVKVIYSKPSSSKLSSKEQKHDNKCSTSQGAGKKSPNIDRQKISVAEKTDDSEPPKGKKIKRAEDQLLIQKKDDRRNSTEISGPNVQTQKSSEPIAIKSDSKGCETTQPENSTETMKDTKVTSEIIHPSTSKATCVLQKSEPSTCGNVAIEQLNTVEDKLLKGLQSCREDNECGVENAVVSMKKSQTVPMSKVDQIKRDLFSDEENSDQRTTRSRTRQISDAQKNDPALAVPEIVSQVETKISQSVAKKPKQELATVLECLKLVPANKNETVDKTNISPKSSINKLAEYEFVYDDSIPIKKKRLKYSSSNLQYEVKVELADENYRECPRLMTSTNYEEIFNISPKPKKRVVAKKIAIKNSKPTKSETSMATNSIGTILKNELIKPLASSSPSVRLKVPISKVSKSTTKSQHKSNKPTDKDDKKKPKDDTQVLKKRKMTDSEEDQSGEKKRRIADPQTLLKKLDLDLFLTSVHGPI